MTIAPAEGPERIVEVVAPEVALAGAEAANGCAVTIRQAGSLGLSPPLELILPASGESP